jgi:hypothetical protein
MLSSSYLRLPHWDFFSASVTWNGGWHRLSDTQRLRKPRRLTGCQGLPILTEARFLPRIPWNRTLVNQTRRVIPAAIDRRTGPSGLGHRKSGAFGPQGGCVLVLDRHALVAVHLLHLVDEVLLGLADAFDAPTASPSSVSRLVASDRRFHSTVSRYPSPSARSLASR